MGRNRLWVGAFACAAMGCRGAAPRPGPAPAPAALAGVEAAQRLEQAWGGVTPDPGAITHLMNCEALLAANRVTLQSSQFLLLASARRNAFSLPENRIYFTRGLYESLTSAPYADDLFAAAIAHELAHLQHQDSLHPCRDAEEMLAREIAADRSASDLLGKAGVPPTALRELLRLISDDQPPEWSRRRLAALAEIADAESAAHE